MKRASTLRKSKHARTICGEFYPTAKSLRERCRWILDQYPQTKAAPDVRLNDVHTMFFVELLSPSVDVAAAYKSTSDGQIGRHLRFVYTTGLSELVGWCDACGSPPKYASEASDAMRWESSKKSRDVAAAFFSSPGPWVCQKSGAFISPSGGFEGHRYHVHHDGKEWAAIRDEWLKEVGITLDDVPIEPQFERGYQMKDGPLKESWVRFHDTHASLVVVSQLWHEKHHKECRAQKGNNA